ncbi:glycoside hydrolase family 5 protein [Steroidobacter sp.]|uniref:glycoside hydrolase family 5 protein n=1 Tax=Steroidobacter sp. TaxID=1978227 RepID=UPI001A46D15E|nr:cellulase family glycosylhydrolase [Steroidobacter sp.]MBL8266680.1 cellulase family glycosylhydrolase [Steroidobacter sp.]
MRSAWRAVLVVFALALSANTHAQFVHTKGTQIVDRDGKPLLLIGPNLGNWLVFEGYMLDIDERGWSTPTGFRAGIEHALGGDEQRTAQFVRKWRESYVNAETLRQIKALGFNSVRVPFSHHLFWDGKALTDEGFQYFDRIIKYCRDLGMYVQFDMHTAPGYQNPGHHSDNPNEQVRESVRFWADWNNVELAAKIWGHIAKRYANEPTIWSWDLINEPVTRNEQEKARLEESYRVMGAAIRAVDKNHILSIQGDWWGSDFSPLNQKWDEQLVFHMHHYPKQGVKEPHDTLPGGLGDRLRKAQKVDVPLWLGEFGENTPEVLRDMTDWAKRNSIGYAPWSFKRIETDRALWSIRPTPGYHTVIDYIKSASYPQMPTGAPPANAFADLMDFADRARNGTSNVTFVPSFAEAVKP